MMNKALLFIVSALFIISALVSCSKDSPDPDGGKTIHPSTNVDDPEGTIYLSMRNDNSGDTWLDGFHIVNENFEDAYFVSLGKVNGLGNVSYIPIKGWSDKVAVIEGNGYVAYSRGNFYRIYVVKEIYGTNGGIIGAEIKYQKAFKGSDDEIKLEDSKFDFSCSGGTQTIKITNEKIIQFSCESNQDWCKVSKSTTTEFDFLENAITIHVSLNPLTIAENAQITLTTLFGKTKTITITRAANTVDNNYLVIGCK